MICQVAISLLFKLIITFSDSEEKRKIEIDREKKQREKGETRETRAGILIIWLFLT